MARLARERSLLKREARFLLLRLLRRLRRRKTRRVFFDLRRTVLRAFLAARLDLRPLRFKRRARERNLLRRSLTRFPRRSLRFSALAFLRDALRVRLPALAASLRMRRKRRALRRRAASLASLRRRRRLRRREERLPRFMPFLKTLPSLFKRRDILARRFLRRMAFLIEFMRRRIAFWRRAWDHVLASFLAMRLRPFRTLLVRRRNFLFSLRKSRRSIFLVPTLTLPRRRIARRMRAPLPKPRMPRRPRRPRLPLESRRTWRRRRAKRDFDLRPWIEERRRRLTDLKPLLALDFLFLRRMRRLIDLASRRVLRFTRRIPFRAALAFLPFFDFLPFLTITFLVFFLGIFAPGRR
mmetsp:Transcript_76020/g.178341  ORF Transcript_76020/g.178341 Transcript_76020/m.178341 type:complete len:353 (-) Transcript_76020:449-1507(-)